jgi:uncharacterized alpha-E superfamily protein
VAGTPQGATEQKSEQLMRELRKELGEARMDIVIRSGLHEYLDGLQTRMNAISDCLTQDFFVLLR